MYVPIDLSTYLSIHPSIHVHVFLAVYFSIDACSRVAVHLCSIQRWIHVSTYLSTGLSVVIATYVCIYLCIYLSDLSIHLPVYLSSCLSFNSSSRARSKLGITTCPPPRPLRPQTLIIARSSKIRIMIVRARVLMAKTTILYMQTRCAALFKGARAPTRPHRCTAELSLAEAQSTIVKHDRKGGKT